MESEACQYCGMSGAHSPECPARFEAGSDGEAEKAKQETLGMAQNAEDAKSRILSDAEKITGKHYEADDDFFDDPARGGAKYVKDKGAQMPRLEFTAEQVKEAHEDMEVEARLRKEKEERENMPPRKSSWKFWKSGK